MDDYRNTLWKAFDDYGIDIVFNGHMHYYLKSKPINLNVSDSEAVTEYGSDPGQGRLQIITGNMGSGDYNSIENQGFQIPYPWYYDKAFMRTHFILVDVSENAIALSVRDRYNIEFDSITLDKN